MILRFGIGSRITKEHMAKEDIASMPSSCTGQTVDSVDSQTALDAVIAAAASMGPEVKRQTNMVMVIRGPSRKLVFKREQQKRQE
eukprot:210887-Pyramimonas_sp.AAC.1